MRQTPRKHKRILYATADLNIKLHLKEKVENLLLQNVCSRSIHHYLWAHGAHVCIKDVMPV